MKMLFPRWMNSALRTQAQTRAHAGSPTSPRAGSPSRPSLPAQQRAGRGGPGAHRMNMAMGTMTLSRTRKPQKMKKVWVASLRTCWADT